jgi:uncharacterized repeat protein (TIGR03806 family)
MRSIVFLVAVSLSGLCGAVTPVNAERPFGMDKRLPWTTSTVKGTPDPPRPYRTERVFNKLQFLEPLAMAHEPQSNRLFVAEYLGKIFSFPNDPGVEKADLLLDLDTIVYGFALHPEFAKNGYIYVVSLVDRDPLTVLPNGARLSRFQTNTPDRSPRDRVSEVLLAEWRSGGHTGGCLKFGPDGYLYVAVGDTSEIADRHEAGQDLSVLPGSILRLDVDHPEDGKAYGIPPDNPFVDSEDARPEIWAYGLRQPWKMSFDRVTGDLWTANVGQDLWEMVYRIERGGNYGWSVTEGTHSFRPERALGPTPILKPILEYDHTQSRSLTGGFVYRGSRLKELAGAYIHGDYDTGRVWGLRHDGEKVTWNEELVHTNLRIVGFGENSSGELYILDHAGGGIHRLVPNTASDESSKFPRRLSQTGLFAATADHSPAPGLIPYSILAPKWSDGAHKEWYIAMPGTSQIELDAILYPKPAPGSPPGWKFPDGTVVVETRSLEMEKGNPESRRRLETRILHHKRLAGTDAFGDQLWRGYTYLWNEEQTDAALLEGPSGLDRSYEIIDKDAPGGKRQQTWHFPSRAECSVCHNLAGKFVLGVNTLQMNKDYAYDGGVVDNQLRTLEHIGAFTAPLPERPEKLPRLVDPSDESQDQDRRARSYLHGNCAFCHRKWGGGNAEFQLLATLDLSETGTVGVRPGQGTFYIPDAKVIAPGDPYRSILFYRMAKLGSGRMPRMGSGVVDERGLDLIHDWIAQLPADSTAPAYTDAAMQSRAKLESTLSTLKATPRGAAIDKAVTGNIAQLLASTGGALRALRSVDDGSLSKTVGKAVVAAANKHPAPHVRDLFERFLPEEQRTKRLGNVIKPEAILALEGDSTRGQKVFFDAAGVQCKNCHRIQGKGLDVGPDLSQVGKKYDRARLLETILEPSKEVDPKYAAYVVETTEGQVFSGLLVKKTKEEVVLKDAQNKQTRVPMDDVKLLVPQAQSMMPELLLRDMTARQVADLVAYLSSLK